MCTDFFVVVLCRPATTASHRSVMDRHVRKLGVMYFPTNWGAKEPQNLPNHRVDKDPLLTYLLVSVPSILNILTLR